MCIHWGKRRKVKPRSLLQCSQVLSPFPFPVTLFSPLSLHTLEARAHPMRRKSFVCINILWDHQSLLSSTSSSCSYWGSGSGLTKREPEYFFEVWFLLLFPFTGNWFRKVWWSKAVTLQPLKAHLRSVGWCQFFNNEEFKGPSCLVRCTDGNMDWKCCKPEVM